MYSFEVFNNGGKTELLLEKNGQKLVLLTGQEAADVLAKLDPAVANDDWAEVRKTIRFYVDVIIDARRERAAKL